MKLILGRALGLALLAAGMAGCVRQTEQQQAAEGACRARAEQVQNRTDRASMIRQDNSTTPNSAAPSGSLDTAALAREDGYDHVLNDCLDGTGPLPAR